ncbi:glucose/arabinose dehydrogenase [Arcticibacter pallidicorallinus]|uniref:Glucose/arabinose dehydrogenase n=1 Tax=Arcticibacter pallidicorallinus TaxID=1259464 RepID=A0A2T0TVW2_9SPHI|nr:sorbosone dehydrogenase family protein [Arcticibacter pallidicorallinus]PRY49842.1 glucose/arabinose dehydrogenase [Arcticibacter pallidicorallinus]
MIIRKLLFLGLGCSLTLGACSSGSSRAGTDGDTNLVTTDSGNLPQPGESKNKFSKVVGWPNGRTPVAPSGFSVSKFAGDLTNPRWIYVAPNGDIFVAQATTEGKKVSDVVSGRAQSQNMNESSNSILIFRDANHDGKPEIGKVFLSGLNQPFGMLIIGNSFYVANTDGLWMYPYKEGQQEMTSPGKRIVELPAGGYNNHWTRNIISSKDKSKIYVSVGSGSNVGENGMEHEVRRANILEINPDGSGERIYAAGLRNPVGMDWNPESKKLWTAVNERDELGDELVPDYITSVKDGAFYGWPYAYFGPNEDPRRKGEKPDLVKKTIAPDLSVGAHTASLGFTFYTAESFPEKYKNGAFIGQHGSWNRSEFSGYKVAFVPFENGKPSGKQEDFLTGFIVEGGDKDVYGRPVGVAVAKDGSLLVADDAGNTIWRVSFK